MADYAEKIEVGADADEIFHFLSDVANLPRYFARMTSAETGDGHEVLVTADLGDRQVEGKAWFDIDNDARSLSWGSEGPNDYHGRLEVAEHGLGSVVSVVLSTTREGGDGVQDGLRETLATIKDLTEQPG